MVVEENEEDMQVEFSYLLSHIGQSLLALEICCSSPKLFFKCTLKELALGTF